MCVSGCLGGLKILCVCACRGGFKGVCVRLGGIKGVCVSGWVQSRICVGIWLGSRANVRSRVTPAFVWLGFVCAVVHGARGSCLPGTHPTLRENNRTLPTTLKHQPPLVLHREPQALTRRCAVRKILTLHCECCQAHGESLGRARTRVGSTELVFVGARLLEAPVSVDRGLSR